MSTFKRDHTGEKKSHDGGPKKSYAQKSAAVRNEYTPMFEYFRNELDQHHERRERITKASRDVTALSKKM
jgi:pyruvate/2-oxoacid:ferredoxin oxidoreductase beta subunit